MAPLYDEVNEPLGLLPIPAPRPVSKSWTLAVAAPIVVAVAMAAFTFGSRRAEPGGEKIAAKTETPSASARTVSALTPEAVSDVSPASPSIATANQIEVSSGVKAPRQRGAGSPTPLIIDVQQALAAAKVKATPIVQR